MTAPIDLDQPDLFGDYDRAQAAKAERAARIAELGKHFRRQTVTIAYESADRTTKPGDPVEGWMCPACGGIEFNDYLLDLNHGWSPGRPDEDLYGRPPFETCTRLEHRASPLYPHEAGESYDGIGVVRLGATP